jgi:Zn-dependent protease
MTASIQQQPASNPLPLTREGAQALSTAQAIATAHGQSLLTSNHILLGIIETPGSYGEQVLSRFPIKLDQLKTRLWAYIRLDAGEDKEPRGGEFYGFPLSEDGARVMAATVEEAEAQHADAIDTRLMILGMLRDPETHGGEILQQFDIHHDTYLEKALEFRPTAAPAPSRSATPRKKAAKGPKLRKKSRFPKISPIFLLLLAIFAGLGYMLYANIGAPGPLIFAFVLVGWIIAVSLHEFGHALVAYLSGDESVAHMGYLTLDPLKYTHPLMSIILPIIFLLMGGIPLPGGAVYINRAAIRKPWQMSAVSAAGPLATLIFGLLLLLPFMFGLSRESLVAHSSLWQAVAVLAFFQIFAFVLNLIPWPGLDGFGIIEPWLPPSILQYAYMLGGMGIFVFFLLFAFTPFGQIVGDSVWKMLQAISLDAAISAFQGFQQFFFWQS